MNRAGYDVDVVGDRVVAQIIDGIILVVLALVLVFGGMAIAGVGEGTGGTSGASGGLGAGMVVFAFLVAVVYNAGLEHHWNGQTLGKRAMGIRVVSTDGDDADFGQVLVRNVPAVVNLGLFSVIAALLSMSMSDDNQRIFDVFADTVVVKAGTAGTGTGAARSTQSSQPTQF